MSGATTHFSRPDRSGVLESSLRTGPVKIRW